MSNEAKDFLNKCEYYLDGYSQEDRGYLVRSRWGNGKMAAFVQNTDAENYIKYANKMLAKFGTTDTRDWNF